MSFDSRPVSRRGIKGSAASPIMDNYPVSASRPTTGMRPPSAMSQQRGPPPNTANRLTTGLVLPKTGSGVNPMARPITQQGLSGLRTGTARGQQRQILDKRYFEGVIRQRMKEIAGEVHKLNIQIETQKQHEATADVYDSRVKEVATELTILQAELADLNHVVDKVHTGGDVISIDEETEDLRTDNTRDAARLEQMFQRNYDMEQKIHRLEEDIQNEKNRAQRLLDAMDPQQREQFERLKETNEQLLTDISQQQQHLDQLKVHSGALQNNISSSQLKQEALQLYQKLWEREERKTQLEEEAKSKATPAQEREQLLARVREDNAEMAAMERHMAQITEQIKNQKQEIELVEQDLEESQSDKHQKLKELKRREETMEQFLATFEGNRDAETERITVLEGKIEVALQQMARNMITSGPLPSQDEFAVIRETLELKQDELENSKMTAEELSREEAKLQQNVKKVEELEEKITNEVTTLREKMATMREEMIVFSDLDALRDSGQAKKNELMELRDALMQKKVPKEELEELKTQNEILQKQLSENDTHVQLHTMEKKLQILQQNNESLKESFASRRSELDYQVIRSTALELLNDYNQKLKKGLK